MTIASCITLLTTNEHLECDFPLTGRENVAWVPCSLEIVALDKGFSGLIYIT